MKFLLLLVAIWTCVACDEGSSELDEERIESAHALFFAATPNNAQVVVLRVAPASGEAVAFDEPLPGIRLDTHRVRFVRVRDALRDERVVVSVDSLESSPGVSVWVSEGEGWQVWVEANGEAEVWSHAVSDNLEHIWVERARGDSGARERHSQLLDANGAVLLEPHADYRPWSEAARLLGFGPEGDWLLYVENDQLWLWRPDTGATAIRAVEGTARLSGAFASSFLFHDSAGLVWLDLEGQPLDVEGFVPEDFLGLYQVSDGAVSRYVDRGLEPVLEAELPEETRAILGIPEERGFVLLGLDGFSTSELVTVDAASGATQTYETPPSTVPGTIQWVDWRQQVYHTNVVSMTGSYGVRSAVLETDHSGGSGDVIMQLETVNEAVRFSPSGEMERLEIRRRVVDEQGFLDGRFYPQYNLDGRWLYWPDNGSLHRLDVDIFSSPETLTHDWTFLDVQVLRP